MEKNPDYDTMVEKRQEFRSTIDASIRRDYYAGLKPSIKRKIPDPSTTLEGLHALVRRIYTNELKHPDISDDVPARNTRQSNLPVFNTQTQPTNFRNNKRTNGDQKQPMQEVRKVVNSMKDVTQTLAKAMVRMTEQGMVKPTARAGTARDPEGNIPLPPPRCFVCQQTDHMARDCPLKTNQSQGRGRGRSFSSPPGPAPQTPGFPNFTIPIRGVNNNAGFIRNRPNFRGPRPLPTAQAQRTPFQPTYRPPRNGSRTFQQPLQQRPRSVGPTGNRFGQQPRGRQGTPRNATAPYNLRSRPNTAGRAKSPKPLGHRPMTRSQTQRPRTPTNPGQKRVGFERTE